MAARPAQLMARFGLLLLVLCVAGVLCLQPPHEFGQGYDRSFLLALSAAHAQGVVFGEQLNYPYGPLAWLCRPLPPSGAVGFAVCVQLAVYALFIALLACLALRVEGRWTAAWCLLVIGAAGLIDPMTLWLAHLEFAVPVVALLAVTFAPERRAAALAGLAGLAATLLLIKLDAGAYAAVLCAGLSIQAALACRADRRACRRLLLLPPTVFATLLGLLFLLESGRLAALPAYLVNAVSVMVGYKEMSTDGAPERLWPMLIALGASLLLLPLLVRDRRRLLSALAVIAVPALMLWQRVAMRQDEGHQTSFLPRLALLLLLPLLALGAARQRLMVGLLQALVLVTGGVFVTTQFDFYLPELFERLSGRQLAQSVSALGEWDETLRGFEEGSVGNGAPLRLGPSARAIVGEATVDAVPWELERIFAHRWHWSPRPALQSSNAYTPRLDGLDARHFEDGDAARFVLADVDTIDGRHIFLEAPLTWRALLDRYDLRAVYPAVLFVERRSAPRFDPPRRLARVEARWDEEVALPESDELVLLACELRPGLAGSVAGLFYRNASVHLDVRYRSGLEQRWRAVRPNLESGAIVSHLPTSRDALAELFASGPGETDRVASIRLHTDEPWQFGATLALEWWTLPLRAEQRPWHTEQPPPAPIEAAWSQLGEDCAEGPVPTLRLTGEPRLGQPVEFVVEGVRPGQPVQLLIGARAVELRRGLSTLFVDPERMLSVLLPADERGVARLAVSIPAQSRLAGGEVTLQALVANEPGAQPVWRSSCGLQVLIGR